MQAIIYLRLRQLSHLTDDGLIDKDVIFPTRLQTINIEFISFFSAEVLPTLHATQHYTQHSSLYKRQAN
jgi:hypothetical protein